MDGTNILLILIFLAFCKCLQVFLTFIWVFWVGHYCGFGVKWKSGLKNWCVVTGATSGIGWQFANEFAKKGYCLLLISRDKMKLQEVRKKLLLKHSKCLTVQVLAIDLANCDYHLIRREVHDLEGDVDVLVNAAGQMGEPNFFNDNLENNSNHNDNLINLNVVSFTKMIEIILPLMVKKRRGIIINISSTVGLCPVPLFSSYCATKSFDDTLSVCLANEYKNKGIVVQSLCPNIVKTPLATCLTKLGMTYNLTVVNPSNYVKSALRTTGLTIRTTGFWRHELILYCHYMARLILGEHLSMRLTYKFFRLYY